MTVHPAGGAPGSKHWGSFKATSILPAVMEQAAAHPTPPAEGGHRGWLGAEGTFLSKSHNVIRVFHPSNPYRKAKFPILYDLMCVSHDGEIGLLLVFAELV